MSNHEYFETYDDDNDEITYGLVLSYNIYMYL